MFGSDMNYLARDARLDRVSVHSSARMAAAAWMICLIGLSGVGASDIEPAADAPPPLSPEQSRQLMQVPAGFRVELCASEPQVADPVAMAFDARGRILVCELHGYNLEGYYDILELNKTGILDQQVRRVPANEEAVERALQQQYGTVKRLEDVDGDGVFERSIVLADRLPPCYGVVAARDGVIVFCAPDIIYLADRDDDGQVEFRETLFTGFGVGEMWTRINNPRWGVDNWIYGVSGQDSGGTIRGPHLPRDVTLPSVCFRFRDDGRALEAAGGKTHGFGQALDQWGERFLVTNQEHVLHVLPLADHYLARNPLHAGPNLTRNVCGYGHPARVYPVSQPDPWRRARAADPAWVRFYGEAEATANGFFTAASGPTIYTARQYPASYWNDHFSVDNAQNLIHRCRLVPQGVSFRAERPVELEDREFLASSEQWFRPVNMVTGPDGMLYVVDMYRDIIEDYSAIPRYLQQQYVRSLIAGADRGRIWRIAHGEAARGESHDLTKMSGESLVDCLHHTNAWWRQTAQRLLVQRQDRSVVPRLRAVVEGASSPLARLHSLYTLDGLEALDPTLVEQALRDQDSHVRVHALRLAERWFATEPGVLRWALQLADDAAPTVQLQLALSLGESRSRESVETLTRLALRGGADPWLPAAVISSAAENAAQLLRTVLAHDEVASSWPSLIHDLAFVVGAKGDLTAVAELLAAVNSPALSRHPQLQAAGLTGMAEGLKRQSWRTEVPAAIVTHLRPFFASTRDELRRAALEIGHHLRIQQLAEMQEIFRHARKVALDDAVVLEERLTAVATLGAAPYQQLASIVDELLDPRHPIELQLAAVRLVSDADDENVTSLLLEKFQQHSPLLRQAIMESLFARRQRLPGLLTAMESGHSIRAMLDAARREQLLENADESIRQRAGKLFGSPSDDAGSSEVLALYQQALQLPRSAERGKAVFEKQCSKCHVLAGQGHEVGPDLANAGTRADETLLADVLTPSQQITVGYHSYNVTTHAGRIHSGILASETATAITLRAEEHRETTILRQDIEELLVSDVSMMPDNLQAEVSPQDVADLLGYLRETLGDQSSSRVVLFDEDPRFIEQLREGDGQATAERRDCFQGRLALRVAPPQRFSATMEGWQYRIAQYPAPGEFRYLRFAWKQPAGDGIMLELADGGAWPAEDESRLRYVSGRNTSPWQAVRVATEPPREWTVVTRDLWQDFGSLLLTGMAPTALGGDAFFDRFELLRTLEAPPISPNEN